MPGVAPGAGALRVCARPVLDPRFDPGRGASPACSAPWRWTAARLAPGGYRLPGYPYSTYLALRLVLLIAATTPPVPWQAAGLAVGLAYAFWAATYGVSGWLRARARRSARGRPVAGGLECPAPAVAGGNARRRRTRRPLPIPAGLRCGESPAWLCR